MLSAFVTSMARITLASSSLTDAFVQPVEPNNFPLSLVASHNVRPLSAGWGSPSAVSRIRCARRGDAFTLRREPDTEESLREELADEP